MALVARALVPGKPHDMATAQSRSGGRRTRADCRRESTLVDETKLCFEYLAERQTPNLKLRSATPTLDHDFEQTDTPNASHFGDPEQLGQRLLAIVKLAAWQLANPRLPIARGGRDEDPRSIASKVALPRLDFQRQASGHHAVPYF